MNILISHSWYDKSVATFIYEKLQEDYHTVWYDIHQLIPGDEIQTVIDEHIQKCDAVIVVVSKNSATSAGVQAEIETARKFNKRIIPASIDENVSIPELQGLLGISFMNREVGIILLRRALILLQIPENYLSLDWVKDSLGNIKDFGGYINYLNSGRFDKEKESEADKNIWIKRIENFDEENRRIANEVMPLIQQQIQILQNIMEQVEKGASKEELNASLLWLEDNEQKLPHFAKQLNFFLTEQIKSASTETNLSSPINFNNEIVSKSISRLQKAIADRKDSTVQHLTVKLKQNFLIALLGNTAIKGITDAYIDYIESSLLALQTLQKIANDTQYVAIIETLNKIAAYIESQNHNAEEQKPYLEAYFDDAYIINNSMNTLLKANLIETSAFQFNFSTMNLVDKYVGFVIPMETKSKLDLILKDVADIVGLKKNEINWKHITVAAASIVLAGAVINNISFGNNNSGDNNFSSFEDNVADFSAENNLKINPYR